MESPLSPTSFLKENIYEEVPKPRRGRKKVDEEAFTVPTFEEYAMLVRWNYNVSQLKRINKRYKLKVSGTKQELVFRIYNYLKYSYYAVRIQKTFRGHIRRKLNRAHGPALFDRSISHNKTDFLTMDDIVNIPYSDFFSFEGEEG